MASGYLAAESMFYCSNILATIDSSCPCVWIEEREVEEEFLTSATKSRLLSPLEFTQLITLNNSIVMEEWRIFYENAKNMSGRPRIFPKFHTYMNEKLVEIDNLLEQVLDISHFPSVNNDVCTIAHGPWRIKTTQSAI